MERGTGQDVIWRHFPRFAEKKMFPAKTAS
jgi:hypothetical protein